MSDPTISVLLPVYNAERYVEDSVRSILQQSFTDFEVLAFDDGSTDGSLSILQALAAEDRRLLIRSRPNVGLVATLNEMIPIARGRYLARMDADDLAPRLRFERQLHFLEKHPEVVALSGAYALIDWKGRFLTELVPPLDDAEIQANLLKGHSAICHGAAMIRARTMAAIGGYRQDCYPAEDVDLFLRLGEHGKLANLEHVLLQHRLHSGSVSELNARAQREAGRRACEAAWARRKIDGTYEATEPHRPGSDRASRFKFQLQYGWWAFQSKQHKTAAAYGLAAILSKPWSVEGWRLLVVALIRKR